jgi:hypothetical protein
VNKEGADAEEAIKLFKARLRPISGRHSLSPATIQTNRAIWPLLHLAGFGHGDSRTYTSVREPIKFGVVADFRFRAHSGLKSDIA